MIELLQTTAFASGLCIAALTGLLPRFGRESWKLLLLLLPACFSAGLGCIGASLLGLELENVCRYSFVLIIIACTGGYTTVSAYHKKRSHFTTAAWVITCILSIFLVFYSPTLLVTNHDQNEYFALGIWGYFSALFLLVMSVMVLATVEQVLRNASETVRWELKFLFIGIAVLNAAIIYMSSQVLLFPPRAGLVSRGAVGLFHSILIVTCVLIAISWKRSSGKARIVVSHGAIYSSITLLSVGVYLIASSLIARWVSRWGEVGLPMEALVFLLSALALTAVLLGTGFRHRTKAWIRRNIFSGSYDYRQFWLEATERVRSIDPPEVTAEALADIVHRAVGAIDVSVWIRKWNPNRLHLLSSQGSIADPLEKEVSGVVEQLLEVSEPLSSYDLDNLSDAGVLKEFMAATKTSLLVPLVSSNRIVGVITVGSDRSGRPYDWEAHEFLRALAGHAAAEFHKSDLLSTLVEAKEDEAFRAFSIFLLHDLKNFASTLSYIAQNAPKHQHNPEFQKDAFQSVYDTAEKMKRLCNSLRAFSSNLASNKNLIDLNQIVRSAADNLLGRRLKLELADLPRIVADQEEIGRVVQNLLVNAMEATPEDGCIIVRTGNNGDHVDLSVEDNGKGMSRGFLEKELFQPFHTTKSGGLGIGLFQSKKIMEAHKGTILVRSEEGKGTAITLRFPLERQPQISQISQNRAGEDAGAPSKNQK